MYPVPVRIGWRMKVDIVGSMPIWFMHNFPIKKEKNFGEVEYGRKRCFCLLKI